MHLPPTSPRLRVMKAASKRSRAPSLHLPPTSRACARSGRHARLGGNPAPCAYQPVFRAPTRCVGAEEKLQPSGGRGVFAPSAYQPNPAAGSDSAGILHLPPTSVGMIANDAEDGTGEGRAIGRAGHRQAAGLRVANFFCRSSLRKYSSRTWPVSPEATICFCASARRALAILMSLTKLGVGMRR
jgi:hypothetical protein